MTPGRRRTAVIMLAMAALFAFTPPAHADGSWNELKAGDNTLGFHGYVRTGASAAFDGDIMPMFIAPGAQSKYRLGNESDSDLELALDYHYYLDGAASPASRYIQLYGMLADYQANPHQGDTKIEFDRGHNPQSFVRLGNFLGDGVNVWAGRRYYDRRDIHMTDHFWLNTGQGAEFGGGIEGIPLGVGRLDAASFIIEDRKAPDLAGGAGVTDNIYSHTLDLRYRGIPTGKGGDLTLWALGAEREASNRDHLPQRYGFGVGGWHTQQGVWGGRDITGFTFRHGVAMQQGLFNPNPVREDLGFDTTGAWSTEVNNDWMADYLDRNFSIQWSTVLRHEERGRAAAGKGSTIEWASTGARPVFYLTDHVSVATEVGVDYVENTVAGAHGFLGKGTVALQFAPKKGFFERPVLRLFATGAAWSDNLKGKVANGNPAAATSYGNKVAGGSYGIQLEWWW
jgi:maltoporin